MGECRKRTSRSTLSAAALVAAAVSVQPSWAQQTFVWQGNIQQNVNNMTGTAYAFNWDATATVNGAPRTNWAGGAIPLSDGATTLVFDAYAAPQDSIHTANTSPNQDIAGDGFDLNQLRFGGGGSYTLNGGPLRFDTSESGTTPAINNLGSVAQTINEPIILGNTLTLAGTGTGTVTLNGNLTEQSPGQQLFVNTAGTYAFSGTSTYRGDTTVTAGTLAVTPTGYVGTGFGYLYVDGSASAPATVTLAGNANGSGNQLTAFWGLIGTNNGSLTQTGGTFRVGVVFIASDPNSTGTLNLQNGLIYCAGFGSDGAGKTHANGSVDGSNGVFQIGYGAGSHGTLNMSGGSLKDSFLIVGSDSGGSGIVRQSGGTVDSTIVSLVGRDVTYAQTGGSSTTFSFIVGPSSNAANYTLSGAATFSTSFSNISYHGNCSFNQSGGTHTTLLLEVGANGGNLVVAPALATYTLTGGILFVNTTTQAFGDTDGYASGTLAVGGSISSAGRFNQAGGQAAVTNLYVAGQNQSTGAFTITAGTFLAAQQIIIGHGTGSTGVLDQTGGAITAGAAYIGGAATATGTYNLSGGTLNVFGIGTFGGTATLNFNGGTLVTAGINADFIPTAITVNVLAGGGTIDTAGSAVTIATPFLHASSLGTTIDGGLTKAGAGTLTLTGAETYTGPTTINAGQIILGSATTLQNSTAVVNTDGGLNVNGFAPTLGGLAGSGSVTTVAGRFTVGGNNTSTTYAGVLSGPGGLTKNGTGTLTLTGINTYIGGTIVNAGKLELGTAAVAPGTLTVTGTANVVFDAATGTGILRRSIGSITATGGVVTINTSSGSLNRTLLVTPSVVLSGSSRLDAGNSDLDVTRQSLSAVNTLVAAGYANGNWNGSNGIGSIAASTDSRHLTALGVVANNQPSGVLFTAVKPFDGVTPAVADVLVKFTFYGDADLDGKVDGSDYTRIDNGYLNAPTATGWFNGDFNYDGKVDGGDYTLIDNAFNRQTATLSPSALVAATAVPEPVSLAMAGFGLLTLFRRTRN